MILITPDYERTMCTFLGIAGKITDEEIYCLQSKWKENKIIGKSNTFGTFTIVIDTIKPEIKSYQENNHAIKYMISDELSGIKEYRGEIDGKWILMEYDFKTGILQHVFKTPPKNKNQQITLSVSDYANNTETINTTFFR